MSSAVHLRGSDVSVPLMPLFGMGQIIVPSDFPRVSAQTPCESQELERLPFARWKNKVRPLKTRGLNHQSFIVRPLL